MEEFHEQPCRMSPLFLRKRYPGAGFYPCGGNAFIQYEADAGRTAAGKPSLPDGRGGLPDPVDKGRRDQRMVRGGPAGPGNGAAAYLAMALWGIFGLEADGMPGQPFLPEGIAHAGLDGLAVRGKEIHIEI